MIFNLNLYLTFEQFLVSLACPLTGLMMHCTKCSMPWMVLVVIICCWEDTSTRFLRMASCGKIYIYIVSGDWLPGNGAETYYEFFLCNQLSLSCLVRIFEHKYSLIHKNNF